MQARYDFVRFARSASAPLPPEQHRAFEARFGIGVVEAMGMTESSSAVLCQSAGSGAAQDRIARIAVRRRSQGGARGRQRRHATAVRRAGRAPAARSQRHGGYYKEPALTTAAITADGWLRSGDLGYRDADGMYFITGRLKELIIKGGENIAPREIDEALLAHGAILEAAAVGIPDAHYGQDILACVVLKPGRCLTEEEIRSHCLRELGRYKTPRIIRIVSDLPKGPSGKIQRLKLLDLA